MVTGLCMTFMVVLVVGLYLKCSEKENCSFSLFHKGDTTQINNGKRK